MFIKLNPPEGYKPYGANANYAPSGETVNGQPVHWFAQCGWGPGGFGNYVFRQVGTNRAEIKAYKGLPDVMDGRGDLVAALDGNLYVTGNESDADRLPEAWTVPGYVPIKVGVANMTLIGDEAAEAIIARLNQLETRFSQLTAVNLQPVFTKLKAVEGVAGQAHYRATTAMAQLQTRDQVWSLAGDRAFTDFNPRVSALESAMRLAESGRLTATEVVTIAERVVRDWFDRQRAYASKDLLNLLWDRAVKLLRYKEANGKTAAELPVNDPKNLEV